MSTRTPGLLPSLFGAMLAHCLLLAAAVPVLLFVVPVGAALSPARAAWLAGRWTLRGAGAWR